MAIATAVPDAAAPRPMTREERRVIIASSLGTVFEWYDFYLYGALAAVIGAQFFAPFPEATRTVFALLGFAAGFIVRPVGALVFGRIGDRLGRKRAFLATILIMGVSTFLVGLLPGYDAIGWAAPAALIALRMAQGFALGGEYGGAATYVAEHAPPGRRGYYTSWIQTTATLGLLLALLVIMATQIVVDANFDPVPVARGGAAVLGPDGAPATITAFDAWGWRIPFLLSVALLGVSVYVRARMQESPAFRKIEEEGARSKAPLSEAFGQWRNAKIALIALFGLVAGQAVIWYTGQLYALFFLQSILRVDGFTANVLVAWSLVAGAAGFVVFGALSDRIGRKPVFIAGCVAAALTYFPLFEALTRTANPALHEARRTIPVTVTVDRDECSFQFDPTGAARFVSSCDVAKAALARLAAAYRVVDGPAGRPAVVTIGDPAAPAATVTADAGGPPDGFDRALAEALTAAGYPAADDPSVVRIPIEPRAGLASFAALFDVFTAQRLTLIGILTVLVLYVTMVYGPLAAALVELFPTRIRYSSMSLPYHVGNGWFGGLLPATSFAMAAGTGDIYFGLWYPVAVALATAVVCVLFVSETSRRNILTYRGN